MKRFPRTASLLPLLALALASGCGEGGFTTTASGLRYQELEEGQGAPAKKGDKVEVEYAGYLQNGVKFDSSKPGETFFFTLGKREVIKGWEDGLVGIKAGGKVILVIYSHLGYGAKGVPGTIPPDAMLVFEVELLKIKQ